MVQVEPEKAIRISDLQIDEKRFRKFKPPDPRNIGFEGYIDQEDGLVIRTREGLIDRINYVAAKQDRHLCPTYADEPEEVVMQIVEPPPPYCPTSVQLSCPKGEVVAGSLVTTSVIFEDLDPALKLSYDWTVSGGMIKSGQGTDTVVVNANGLEGQLLKVAVKIGGLDVVCVSYLTCEMRITKRRKG
jgi:hypothetical protein